MKGKRLRQVLTVESLATVEKDDGSFSRDWTVKGTRRANIDPLRGREFFESQQVQAIADHKVTLRHYSGLLPETWRFTLNGRVLNIVSVANLEERGRYMEVLCKEAV